jgi:hypothetical protein
MTVQQFLHGIFRDLVVVYPGQTESVDQSNEALLVLNEILGSWSHEGLLVPGHAVNTYSLAAGTSAYTLGVGATWSTAALPVKVKGAMSSLLTFQHGVQVMPMGDFEMSIANELGVTAGVVTKMGVDNAAPNRNIRVWPTPNNSSALIEVSYWMPLAAFATLGDTVAFALPAFELAIRNELALRLAHMHGIPVSQDMMSNAQSSKLALTRIDPSEPPTDGMTNKAG